MPFAVRKILITILALGAGHAHAQLNGFGIPKSDRVLVDEIGQDFLSYLFWSTPVGDAWKRHFYQGEELDLAALPAYLKSWAQQKQIKPKILRDGLVTNLAALQGTLEQTLQSDRLQNEKGEVPKMDYLAQTLSEALRKLNFDAPAPSAAKVAVTHNVQAEEARVAAELGAEKDKRANPAGKVVAAPAARPVPHAEQTSPVPAEGDEPPPALTEIQVLEAQAQEAAQVPTSIYTPQEEIEGKNLATFEEEVVAK